MNQKPYSPNSHVVDFINSVRSRTAVARTIRNFRRLVQGNPRGRSIDYSAIDSLLALRNAQPDRRLTDYSQIVEAGILTETELDVLRTATWDENRVILQSELKSRANLRIGGAYRISLNEFPFPDFEVKENSYFEQTYYGLPRYSTYAKYTNYLIGPGGSKVQMSFDRLELDGVQVRSAVLSFGFSYDHIPGNYQMVFEFPEEQRLSAPLSFNAQFEPYIVNLGDEEVFALRYGFASAKPAAGNGEVQARQLVVLKGKRDSNVPANSRSTLQAFLPRAVEPSEFLVTLPKQGSREVDFFTDTRIAKFFNARETIVGISGKSQDKPDSFLRPRIRLYEQDSSPITLVDENGVKSEELIIIADTNVKAGVDADLGGFVFRGGVAAVFPQVSFLVKPKEMIRVDRCFVNFIGAYHQRSRRASEETLQLRTVPVTTAMAGDTVERAMAVFGRVDGRNGKGSSDLLVLFNKGLVMAFDCLDLTKRPSMVLENQVSDPNGTSSKVFTPERDVLNPGLNIALKRNKKGLYASSPKDAGPRKAGVNNPGNSDVGGRRYGLIYLHPREVPGADPNAMSILTIAHSLPRKADDNGGAIVPGFMGINQNDEGVPFGIPAQATVTVYPPLGLNSKGFLKSRWLFSLRDGVTPIKTDSGNNGNESYFYRHFRECFRKGGEKAKPELQRDYFNGKGVQGGTPVRCISNFDLNRPLFFISEVPFLVEIPVRTFLIDSRDGRTIWDMDDLVAQDLYELGNGNFMLLGLRRVKPKPTPKENMDKAMLINYFRDFMLSAYQVRVQNTDNGPAAEIRLLETNFGSEQPFFMDFNELDDNLIPMNIGVQGTAANLIAPEVYVQGQKYILTATPPMKNDKGSEVGNATLHLYLPQFDEMGKLSLQKDIANIALPEGRCQLLRVTQGLQAEIPFDQLPVDPAYGSSSTFINDTVFIVQQELVVDGSINRRLLFCKVGKLENGAFALIPGELVTNIANYS